MKDKLLKVDRRYLYLAVIVIAVMIVLLIFIFQARQTVPLPENSQIIQSPERVTVTVGTDINDQEKQQLEQNLKNTYPNKQVEVLTDYRYSDEFLDTVEDRIKADENLTPEDLSPGEEHNDTPLDGDSIYGN